MKTIFKNLMFTKVFSFVILKLSNDAILCF
jgi:hypothetical protein